MKVTDVDGADEAKFVAGNGVASTGALGSLSITEGGAWTYNVDNSKVQYLGEGETKVETFVVESVDGTTHTVTITITGVNDAAVITGTDTGGVTEDESNPTLTETSTLTVTDVDGADEPSSWLATAPRAPVHWATSPSPKAVPGPITSTTVRCSTWARVRPRSRPLGRVRGRHHPHVTIPSPA